MKRNFGVWACLVISIMMVGCNGYEDGPAFSLRSKENRLVGWKKIAAYEVDGVDSLPMIEAAFANTTYDSTGFKWVPEIEESQIFCTQGCVSGYWEFQNEGEALLLVMPAPQNSRVIFPIGQWTILRLSHNDLWVSIDSMTKHYVLKLIRI